MKAKTIQVVWHGKEPVYSLDFHPTSGLLATAGADKEVKTWRVANDETGYPTVEHVDSLVGHSKTVNCVRFSPDGQTIASAADGGELMLWVATSPDEVSGKVAGNLVSDEEASAEYKRHAVLRGHVDDVMDVAWSGDGSALISGSIDNQSIVWNPEGAGKLQRKFDSHKHFVQGVAWDPHCQYFLTISADRMCKVHALKPKKQSNKQKAKAKAAEEAGAVEAAGAEKEQEKEKEMGSEGTATTAAATATTLSPAAAAAKKTTLERINEFFCADSISKRVAGSASGDTKRVHLFHDETLPSFFRRLSWSPDGSFVVIPSGVYREDVESPEMHTAYMYARGKWTSPIAHVPGQTKPVVAVRFCPVVFERSDDGGARDGPFENLPYTMVYAVATLDSVVIYDTASSLPLAAFCQLHYDSISDLAWSKDGKFLAVSSRDCFCSIISFEDGDLGKPADVETLPQVVQDVVRPPAVAPIKAAGKSAAMAATAATAPLNVASNENADGNQPRQEAVVKRRKIVPTPVGDTATTPGKDAIGEAAHVASAPAPPVSSTMTGTGPKDASKKKRITPQPVSKPATLDLASGGIASMAALMGQAEADK